MNSKNNFKWLNQDLLSPNENQRYYYDFGTGEKTEREEVKKQRDAFLGAISANGGEPQKQEKDAFLEGFNDPYEEKLEQKRKQRERERKEKFADVRANADKRERPFQNTSVSQADPFLEGFNSEVTQQNEIKENRERKERLLQGIYAGHVMMTTTPLPLTPLRIRVGRTLEEHVKEKHYGRNKYNVDLPQNKNEAIEKGWQTELADCHQNTAPKNEPHIKYVSPDGKHRENIFNNAGNMAITAVEDEPTYNYASPDWELEHGVLDVLPWIRYGNEPEDPTTWYKRIGGALGLGR